MMEARIKWTILFKWWKKGTFNLENYTYQKYPSGIKGKPRYS